ncbi:MAG: hypothetical protein PHV51_05655 [Methanosarcinaceae archaeon]|nr:hypothetical protein [Methanosarcinaceae archaeon]
MRPVEVNCRHSCHSKQEGDCIEKKKENRQASNESCPDIFGAGRNEEEGAVNAPIFL